MSANSTRFTVDPKIDVSTLIYLYKIPFGLSLQVKHVPSPNIDFKLI